MKIDRLSLYNLIWSVGIHKCAKDLGIARHQLMKICADHDIPVPSRSYWSILKLGKIVPERTPLSHSKKNDTIEIPSESLSESGLTYDKNSISDKNNDEPTSKSVCKNKDKAIMPVILKAGTLPVNEEELEKEKEKLRKKALLKAKSHALQLDLSGNMEDWLPKIETAVIAYPIRKVLYPKKVIILDSLEYYTNRFKSWSERDSGRYYCNRKNSHLALAVSKDMLRPALAVYDSIIDVAEALGLTLSYKEEGRTQMCIGDFKTDISVREINRQVMVTDPGSRYTHRELKATGKLKLVIEHSYNPKEYKETDYINIQEKLVDFFKGLMKRYLSELEWREEQRQRELREREAAEKRRLEELERQRIAALKEAELQRIEGVIRRAYKLKVFQSLQNLAIEMTKRGNEEKSAEILEVAKMFDPVSPQYGDLLEDQDIDNLVRRLMNKDKIQEKGLLKPRPL